MAYDEEGEEEEVKHVPWAEYQADKTLAIYSRDDTGHDLTVEEQLFVRSYVIDRNPVAALKRLDYAGDNQRLKTIARRYLANPEVQGAIEVFVKRLADKLEITAEKVARQLAQMAFFDPRTVMQWDGLTMRVLDSRLWPDEAVAAIAGMKMTEKAGMEIKLVDKLKATEVLGRQLNLLQDPDEAAKKAAADAAAGAVIDKMSQVFERLAGAKKPDETATIQ